MEERTITVYLQTLAEDLAAMLYGAADADGVPPWDLEESTTEEEAAAEVLSAYIPQFETPQDPARSYRYLYVIHIDGAEAVRVPTYARNAADAYAAAGNVFTGISDGVIVEEETPWIE